MSTPSAQRKFVFRIAAILIGVLGCELVLQVGSLLVESTRETPALRADALRILCVGDSNTFGVFVEPGESYPDRLAVLLEERLGEPVETIVLATPGFNTAQMRHRLGAELDRHQPDLMILLGGANNNWNPLETAHWGAPSRLDAIDRSLSRVRLYKLLRLVLDAQRAPPDPTAETAYEGSMDADFLFRVTRDDAEAMLRMAERHGTLAMTHSYFASFGHFPLLSSALESAALSRSTLYVDHARVVEEALASMPRETFYFPDSHLRAPGYEVISRNLADQIVPWLSEKRESAGQRLDEIESSL